MSEKAIASKLWNLSKKIIEKVEERKNRGEVIKTKRLYLKSKITMFDYKEGFINFGKSFDSIEKEEWHWKSQFDFMEMVIKQLLEYKEMVSEISTKYKAPKETENLWLLSRFVIKLINQTLEGVADEILADYITTFIRDLERGRVEWKLKIWIEGVWPEDNEYEIYDGLKIRRTAPSDLEFEKSLDLTPLVPVSGFEKTPPTILELTYRSRNESEIYDEIEAILDCLRLFRVGSVFSVKTEMHPKSFLIFGGTMFSNYRLAPIYKYIIKKRDIPKLKDLIEKVKTLLPKRSLEETSEEISPVVISLQRYNDALLKPESVESRITSAITSFEALYLKAKERTELSHKLSQRVAALLRFFNFTPLEVYNTLKQAYDIRSTFIHGSQIKTEKHENVGRLAEKVLEYARVSLLFFLQLKDLIDKDKLLNKIDNSLLDVKAHSKLERFIKENCKVYLLRW